MTHPESDRRQTGISWQLDKFGFDVVQTMAEGIVVQDAEGYIVWANPAACALTGYALDELIGLHWTVIIPPKQHEIVRAADERREQGQSDRYELNLLCRDKTQKAILASGSPWFDAAGRFGGTMAVFTDITAQQETQNALRQTARQQQQLIGLARHLVSSLDVTEVLKRIAVGAQDVVDAYGCFISLLSADGRTLIPVVAIDPLYEAEILAAVIDVECSFSGQAVKAGQGLIFNDAHEHKVGQQIPGTPVEREHIIVVPLLADDRVLGAMCLSRQTAHFTPDDLALVETLATYASIALRNAQAHEVLQLEIRERRQAEAELAHERELLRILIDHLPDNIYVKDTEGRFLLNNAASLRILNARGQEEVLGKTDFDFMSSDLAAHYQSILQAFLKAGKAVIEQEVFYPERVVRRWVADTKILLHDAQGQIIGLLGVGRDITARKEAEQAREQLLAQLRQQAEQVQLIIDVVPDGVLLLDEQHRLVRANPAGRQYLAVLADTRMGEVLDQVGGISTVDLLLDGLAQNWREIQIQGRTFQVIVRPMPAVSTEAEWVLVIRDMTPEHELQERLRQQDRMAVMGQLAGGVAHDFNNILTAIRGYVELVLGELVTGHPLRADLEEVQRAADRAASLTNQLLVFSRRQWLKPQLLNLNVIVSEMEKMLRSLISENIALHFDLTPKLGLVMADPGQIEQVVMNLVVNARDAMLQGGILALSTQRVNLDRRYAESHPGVEAGPYALLAVSDTGIGIEPEILPHIFEPFFTTKPSGKGTGLGLSTVHGIVTQSEGHVDVESMPGQGSTFRVYLPLVPDGTQVEESPTAPGMSTAGTETILLVEDEVVVRELARRVLDRRGYTVLVAHTPGEAIQLMQEYHGPIALLLTDVVMPEMDGGELARRLRANRPEMRVLYMSGYTEDAIEPYGISTGRVSFLEKPFSPNALADKVREVLDMPLKRVGKV
ncbi:MAG: PAS domain-containing protein [Anaerolineae bacterium]|nr:PAS domain-containing protein [Anaerolineae bacterium]